MATTSKKMMITDVFVNGAFQGWNILHTPRFLTF